MSFPCPAYFENLPRRLDPNPLELTMVVDLHPPALKQIGKRRHSLVAVTRAGTNNGHELPKRKLRAINFSVTIFHVKTSLCLV